MTDLVEFAKWRNRHQRAEARQAEISRRIKLRAAGYDIPQGRLDRPTPTMTYRQTKETLAKLPQTAKDVRAAAEQANKTVQQIDPVRVERIAQSAERTAGHVASAANAPVANAAANLAGKTLPTVPKGAGKAALGLAALGAAGATAAGVARRRSNRLLAAAAARRERQKTARTALLVGGGLGSAALLGRKPVEKADYEEKRNAVAAGAAGTGAALLAAQQLKPTRDQPLSRRGQKVHAKLARSKKETVKLKPKDWAAISGGLGGRRQNDAYTAKLAQAIRGGKVKAGGTTARVYGDTVRTTGGHHRAYASSMLGRKVPVKITHRSQKKAPPLPAFLHRKATAGANMQRLKLAENRNLSRRELKRLASQYSAKSEKWNNRRLLSTAKGRATLAAGAIGAAALAGGAAEAKHRMEP
jgi:hypothetical protein